ncbi:hypothetical protein [Clostridium algidicarnis]|uniref:Uncharacterized protein n=1 Tax=Clostridium algidicarnis DSM 15099 TaxID=1121295 RepID=A0A2S6FV17_9CLOT|nr:hypothetical protein [Clostridium algidicarnis]PPK45260.1 hypothetical protein BD821_1208 [Clostridium algidicarnis DSM 15099]
MSGGLNKGINNKVIKINSIIQEYNLENLRVIRFLDEDDEKISKYDEVIEDISSVIAQLQMVSTPAAPRTEKKKCEYDEIISELKVLKLTLSYLREKHR